ncbi:MAG: hypothetical protein ACYTEV_09390 [Planctomycetota bacterium]
MLAAALLVPAAATIAAAPSPASPPAVTAAPADADDPFSRTVLAEGLEVRTTIRATSYRWRFTNRAGTPIREIALPAFHTAGIVPPDGWSYRLENDRITMTADRAGLGPGRSITLVAQTPFDLARVAAGDVDATRIDGAAVRVAGVWVPGPKRRAAWWLTAGGVLGIAGVHRAAVEGRRRRRAARGSVG